MAQAKIYWDLEMYQQVSHGIMLIRDTNDMGTWHGELQKIVADEIARKLFITENSRKT